MYQPNENNNPNSSANNNNNNNNNNPNVSENNNNNNLFSQGLFNIVEINPRPHLTNESVRRKAYFDEVSKQMRQNPQKHNEEHLTLLAEKKAYSIELAEKVLAQSDDILTEQQRERAEKLKNPPIVGKNCPVAQMAKTSGRNSYDQDCYNVSSVYLADLEAAEVATALREAVLQMGAYISSKASHYGSTMVVAIVRNNGIYTASVGDSNVVLVTENVEGAWQGRLLHKIHSPSIPEEVARAEQLKGKVENGRLDGLGITRSLGDSDVRGISYDPEISHYILPKNTDKKYVLLYTDGLSDVMSEAEVADVIKGCSVGAPNNDNMASLLCSKALEHNSSDNIAVIVSAPLPLPRQPVPFQKAVSAVSPVYIVLDGHGSEYDEKEEDKVAQLVKEIAENFPTVLQQQVDKMLFLRDQLTELRVLSNYKNTQFQKTSTRSLFSPKKHPSELCAEVQALATLSELLEMFKMTGDYSNFDEKIKGVIAAAQERHIVTKGNRQYSEGFDKLTGGPREGKVLKFCDQLLAGAEELADQDLLRVQKAPPPKPK